MPTIGFGELLLVLFIALMVIGPKQLPVVARKIGHGVGYLKHLWNNALVVLTNEPSDYLKDDKKEDDVT